jgi:UDP-N-acetylmuramyl pentapeptide phosphotransferase/UDP-N-acetylglucosamine-1-phosphate transferase
MDDIQGLALALPLAVAFFAALATTPFAGRLATRIGASRPAERARRQPAPGMPLLGGLAVAAAFFIAMIAVDQVQRSEPTRGAGSASSQGDSARGDRDLGRPLRHERGAQAHDAGDRGVDRDRVGIRDLALLDPAHHGGVELPRWIVWPASLLWIVGVTNALNLLDGLDGLARASARSSARR